MDSNYKKLKNIIEEANSIVIISHVNPDGDTLGSSLALKGIIKNFFQKDADSVYIGNLPSVYSYLPDYNSFIEISDVKNKSYDLAIAVDVASKDRLTNAIPLFDNSKIKVNIDHHKTNIGYGDFNIIDGKAACVGVILYRIFKEWGCDITLDIARCIYTSLMTDTGNYRYENTTPEVFMLAAELVKIGVSPSVEYRACYESKPQNMVEFQNYILSKSKFYNNGKIAFTQISQSDMAKYNAKDDYTEGIVEVLRTSKDVEIAGLLKETKDGYTKVSLRSKTFDLTPIVADFSGGGHSFAAGCTIKKPLSIAYDKLLERVQSEIK